MKCKRGCRGLQLKSTELPLKYEATATGMGREGEEMRMRRGRR
jgi:hypothetical protein